ncbi:MAG TPA: glycosyltransferase [Stellaceae bacterium]|nr:glycosyltransferase [Stellaceae bacterium]
MIVSVVVRSRDEADRLRLTLASLKEQTARAEIVVVNDGSADHTADVIAEAAASLPLTVVDHATPRGRSGAANAGARAATGDILLFLDGDTLAGPDFVARHGALHTPGDRVLARGETFHLRCTRFLRDPDTGTPAPGQEARLARLPASELKEMRVTRDQVIGDFAAIERRAMPGIYPGAGPHRLYELEMEAIVRHPACTVLWAAVSAANLSVRRQDFLRVGGFDEALDINEHRELALRLTLEGARILPALGARTYHMTHRSGWRDPIRRTDWQETFYRAHPIPAVKLLPLFWASLSDGGRVPAALRINSLLELEAASRGEADFDPDAADDFIRELAALP